MIPKTESTLRFREHPQQHRGFSLYFNQKPITKRSPPTENNTAEAFAILISTGFKLDKGDLYVPNHVLFLRPIALIPTQAVTHRIKANQNIISYNCKRTPIFKQQALIECSALFIPYQYKLL